jgi:hypothetical protein
MSAPLREILLLCPLDLDQLRVLGDFLEQLTAVVWEEHRKALEEELQRLRLSETDRGDVTGAPAQQHAHTEPPE